MIAWQSRTTWRARLTPTFLALGWIANGCGLPDESSTPLTCEALEPSESGESATAADMIDGEEGSYQVSRVDVHTALEDGEIRVELSATADLFVPTGAGLFEDRLAVVCDDLSRFPANVPFTYSVTDIPTRFERKAGRTSQAATLSWSVRADGASGGAVTPTEAGAPFQVDEAVGQRLTRLPDGRFELFHTISEERRFMALRLLYEPVP